MFRHRGSSIVNANHFNLTRSASYLRRRYVSEQTLRSICSISEQYPLAKLKAVRSMDVERQRFGRQHDDDGNVVTARGHVKANHAVSLPQCISSIFAYASREPS